MRRQEAARASSDDWWAVWPGLYEAELAAFQRHGAEVRERHKAVGRLIIDVDWPHDGGSVRLTVGYSPLHPFFRPTVVAPDLQLERHQNPLSQGLCLLTQASGEWDPAERVADLVAEQLPKIIQANAARAAEDWVSAAQLEENAPDPLTAYYVHAAQEDSAVFFPGSQPTPAGTVGFARFAVQDRRIGEAGFEAVLQKLEPSRGAWAAKPFQMAGFHASAPSITGRWVRMAPPRTDDPVELLRAANEAIARATALEPGLTKTMSELAAAPFAMTAILYPEEIGYGPGQTGNAWLFIASYTEPDTRARTHRIIRGFRLTDDLMVRVPVAAALRSKAALVIGVGAIGSFAAIELARAGVRHLTIVDCDVVEPGNSVRWPLGRPWWGVRKVSALQQFISTHYPTTTVRAVNWTVGAATAEAPSRREEKVSGWRALSDMIAEADVVIDTSASTECQHAIAFQARQLGKGLVVGYATEGAAGGLVARFQPQSPACFVCLQEHWREEDFPSPAVDPAGTVVPIGCNQPTFTGGAFDLQEVSLQVVRAAIAEVAPEAYPSASWDVAVLSHVTDGLRHPPRWETALLRPTCSGCKSS